MQIQNSLAQRIHAENNHIEQPLTSPLAENLSLLARTSNGLLHPMEHGSSLGIQPDVQKILHAAFAVQREEILTQPSSSNNTRLAALDSLEERDFQSAEGGLRIRLTGKGLGGAGNSPEWDELLLDDDEDYETNIRADIGSWQQEVITQEANILSTANALYAANQDIANERMYTSQGVRASTVDERDELQKKLSFYQSELRLAKEQVRYYQGLLKNLA